MALILEIRDARGIPSWHRLDSLPLTIGRALSNGIILDDPYLDAQHARITLGESGELTLDDLESVNGVRINGSRVRGPLAIEAGSEVRIGRTVLHFRDIDEAVVPALADDGVASHESAVPAVATPVALPIFPPTRSVGVLIVDRVLATTVGRMAITAVMIAAYTWNAWLGDTERSSGSAVFGAGFIIASMAMAWAGLWSLGGPSGERRHHLPGHLAVVSTGLLVLLAWNIVNDWLMFLFPDAGIISFLFLAIFLAVLAAMIAGHLGISGTLPSRARWRAGFVTAGVVAALLGFATLVSDDDEFTDVPKIASVIRPMPTAWVPTRTVGEFGEDMQELKDDVDEALAKRESKEPTLTR